jgi:hypothetical protein
MGEEMIPCYAVIPTYNKPEKLSLLCSSLDYLDGIVVVDNGEYSVPREELPNNCTVVSSSVQPPNLSLFWNSGLDIVRSLARLGGAEKWDVAILNDDAVIPSKYWYAQVAGALRNSSAAVACGVPQKGNKILTEQSPWVLSERLCGWAHISRGELGIRFDEDLKWWFGDTAYDKEARRAGGLLLVGQAYVINTDADVSTNANSTLQTQAGMDRQTYITKWGDPGW